MPTRIILIAALAENDVIGIDDRLPWRLRADMRRFRKLTSGNPIIMGRKTWDSLGGKPLPKRRNIVISRQANLLTPGAEHATSPEAAVQLLNADDVCYVIGGAEIYRLFMPSADRLELTRVRDQTDGNVTFPPVNWDQWQLVEVSDHCADENNEFPVTFETWERSR
jgi:dihydrofolate reductase